MPENENEKKSSFGDKMKGCKHFCYNSDTGEVLGRNAGSWAKIGLFYLFYYAALAGFFAICLAVFFTTMDSQSPTQQNLQSLLKLSPGMGFRPFTDVLKTLIKFNADEPDSYESYVRDLDETLSIYMSSAGGNAVDCSVSKPDDSTVCNFPLSMLGHECSAENNYGYAQGKPCVLLKINKIYGWKPVPFENGTEEGVPPALVDRIDPDYIGVTCDGESEADDDGVREITFYPAKGFPVVYYPYLNQDGYQPPVVMAQFDVMPGRLLMFWCRVWGRNIKHHRMDLQGSVRFELLVDYDTKNATRNREM